MRLFLRFLMFLILFGAVGLIGFAYLGELAPESREAVTPVTLDAE